MASSQTNQSRPAPHIQALLRNMSHLMNLANEGRLNEPQAAQDIQQLYAPFLQQQAQALAAAAAAAASGQGAETNAGASASTSQQTQSQLATGTQAARAAAGQKRKSPMPDTTTTGTTVVAVAPAVLTLTPNPELERLVLPSNATMARSQINQGQPQTAPQNVGQQQPHIPALDLSDTQALVSALLQNITYLMNLDKEGRLSEAQVVELKNLEPLYALFQQQQSQGLIAAATVTRSGQGAATNAGASASTPQQTQPQLATVTQAPQAAAGQKRKSPMPDTTTTGTTAAAVAPPVPTLTPNPKRQPPRDEWAKRRKQAAVATEGGTVTGLSIFSASTSTCAPSSVEPSTVNAASVPADIGALITWISPMAVKINGHFCDVFEGFHSSAGKVALKRPRIGIVGGKEDVVRRFQREALTWKKLQHPHILKFLGTFQRDGHYYFVSPFIDNGTLAEYVTVNPSIDRIKLLCESADAISYLHTQEMIHGDIKASNILIKDNGGALLCDFGLTRTIDFRTSTAMKGAGTLRWQSPELWDEGGCKTFKSDVYAFGMTIVEVLSGDVPFPQLLTEGAVMRAVWFEGKRPPKTPLASSTGLSYGNVWAVAEDCWRAIPEERISMAEAFLRIQRDAQFTVNQNT